MLVDLVVLGSQVIRDFLRFINSESYEDAADSSVKRGLSAQKITIDEFQVIHHLDCT